MTVLLTLTSLTKDTLPWLSAVWILSMVFQHAQVRTAVRGTLRDAPSATILRIAPGPWGPALDMQVGQQPPAPEPPTQQT